jgi:hypothetical protein
VSDNWPQIWRAARANMPRVHPRYMGSPTVLRTLLGYAVVTKAGRKMSCALHVRTAMDRGDKPRDPQRQRLLKMLAGPHGTTLAKAIAIQRGIDLSKYKVWPK